MSHDYVKKPDVWNWAPDPERLVFLDFETQSAADLRKIGSDRYLRHESTRMASLVAAKGDRILVWVPKDRGPLDVRGLGSSKDFLPSHETPRTSYHFSDETTVPYLLRTWVEAGYTFAAHNALGFDALAWPLLVTDREQLQPKAWYDTVPPARAAGLPGRLNDAAKAIGMEGGKNETGAKALTLLMRAKAGKHGWEYPRGTPALWASMLAYNVDDVLLLQRLYECVDPYGEIDVIEADRRINARGVRVDTPYLATLLRLWGEVGAEAFDRVRELTDGDIDESNLRSVPQVRAWCAAQGVPMESLDKAHVNGLAEYVETTECEEKPNAPLVLEVLQQRQLATTSAAGKVPRALAMTSIDGRIRDTLVYHGAHTGRWSGRGVQLHNLPRGDAKLDVESLLAKSPALTLDDLKEASDRAPTKPTTAQTLSTLLRPAFLPDGGCRFVIADYGAVEARGVGWLAQEPKLMSVFADPNADPYCEMASLIYGREITKRDKAERNVGKVTMLGAGYSMGAPKFGVYCRNARIELHAAGTTPEACIKAYREAYPMVAGTLRGKFRRGGLWKDYDAAIKRVIERNDREGEIVGRVRWCMERGHLHAYLPSGRPIVYRDAMIEDLVPAYCAPLGLPLRTKPTPTYASPHGYRKVLYGGLATENVCQAVCRDLLATTVVRLEQMGYEVAVHVHDEVVVNAPRGIATPCLHQVLEVMSTPPAWAEGFPLVVEGFLADRFLKAPIGKDREIKYMNGAAA